MLLTYDGDGIEDWQSFTERRNREFGERRPHVLCVSRDGEHVTFDSVYPGRLHLYLADRVVANDSPLPPPAPVERE